MTEDDPVLASYDVYLDQPSSTNSSNLPDSNRNTKKLFLLQYPSHRSASKPYDTARSQKPVALRLKNRTGLVEIDVPFLTSENYNSEAGEKYGKALSGNRTVQAGGTFGLAGGFNTGPRQPTNLRNIPLHDDPKEQKIPLTNQVLGGKIVASTERDPVYMLGCFSHNELHLTPLDALVQLRPQLHHIDAEEENGQKRFQGNPVVTDAKVKPAFETATPKIESKPVEIKIRDNKEDGKDSNLNENGRLLMDIQMDHWSVHQWVDQDDQESQNAIQAMIPLASRPHDRVGTDKETSKLKSCISNGDWLDRMSAPREDGKKGLLAKLRGRERERARRKKAEEEKRQKLKEKSVASTNPVSQLADVSTDSELSTPDGSENEISEDESKLSDGEQKDTKMIDMTNPDEVEVKQEPSTSAGNLPSFDMKHTLHASSTKRGRRRKSETDDTVIVDD